MSESSALLGFGLVLVAIVISAMRETFLGNLLQGISPAQVLFLSFLTLVPLLLALRGPSILRKGVTRNEIQSVAILNFTTVCSWVFLLLGLKHIEPAMVVALSACTGPLWFRVVPKAITGSSAKQVPASRVAEVGIWITIGFAIALQFLQKPASLNESTQVAGILFSLLVAFAGTIGTIESKKLSNLGWKSIDVQASRYLGVLPLAVIAIWASGDGIPSQSKLYVYGAMLSVGIIMATTLLQQAVKVSTPIVVMMGLAFSPIVTFIIQQLYGSSIYSTQNAAVVFAISIFSLFGVIAESKRGVENASASS